MDEILEGANVQELADPVVTDNQVEEPVVPDGDAGTAEPETTERQRKPITVRCPESTVK